MLLLPFFVFGLARILQRVRHGAPAVANAAGHPASANAGATGHLPPGNPWPVLVLFAVVAMAAAALTAYRRRRTARPAAGAAPDPEPDAEPLAEALAAGEQALHEDPDPRTAIIGCYAAMERSLADAGSPPRMADTPAEVLAGRPRAAWSGPPGRAR